VNGREESLAVDNRSTLLDVLRERLGLTGTKKGCGHGQCGTCTILLDGRRVNSCLIFAVAQQAPRSPRSRASPTAAGYIRALGGELKVIADFGDSWRRVA